MNIQETIETIRTYLSGTFAAIDTWFDKEPSLRAYRPASKGWTIDEILEHISLTNHFLLILIDKGAAKALQNLPKHNLAEELKQYDFREEKLTAIGLHKSFTWIRPEHMEPTGKKPLAELRALLQEQLGRCLDYLEQLQNGEGIIYKTTMSVNNLGKIDVYEYIYFLAQHGQRHITQMEKNEAEYLAVRN